MAKSKKLLKLLQDVRELHAATRRGWHTKAVIIQILGDILKEQETPSGRGQVVDDREELLGDVREYRDELDLRRKSLRPGHPAKDDRVYLADVIVTLEAIMRKHAPEVIVATSNTEKEFPK